MKTYIDHLNNSINNTTESEFEKNLTGGNVDLEGGFPSVYECDQISDHISDQSESSRDRKRNVTKLNNTDITKILDRRRTVAPFINISENTNKVNKVDDVNSDSITNIKQEDNIKNIEKNEDVANIGGFLDLFEQDNNNLNLSNDNSIELPNNLSIISKEESLKNNIESKDIDIVRMESETSIMLPSNIELTDYLESVSKENKVDKVDSDVNDYVDTINSIVLPSNLEITDNIQEGGDVQSDADSIELLSEINIIDINEAQNGGYDDIASETSDYNINSVNETQNGGYIDISSETSDNNLGLRATNPKKNSEDYVDVTSDTEFELPIHIEVIEIVN